MRWIVAGSAVRGAVRGAAIDPWATLAAVAIVSLAVLSVRLWLEARRSKGANGAE